MRRLILAVTLGLWVASPVCAQGVMETLDDRFPAFAGWVRDAGLTPEAGEAGVILAPTDATIAGAAPSPDASGDALQRIVRLHLIPGGPFDAASFPGILETAGGPTLSVALTGNGVEITGPSGNIATITAANIETDGAIIHGIDAVFLPEDVDVPEDAGDPVTETSERDKISQSDESDMAPAGSIDGVVGNIRSQSRTLELGDAPEQADLSGNEAASQEPDDTATSEDDSGESSSETSSSEDFASEIIQSDEGGNQTAPPETDVIEDSAPETFGDPAGVDAGTGLPGRIIVLPPETQRIEEIERMTESAPGSGLSAASLIGRTVEGPSGSTMGRVADILLDLQGSGGSLVYRTPDGGFGQAALDTVSIAPDTGTLILSEVPSDG